MKKFIPQQFINIFFHLPKAILANIVYGFPARGLKVIGVTGTDGKTTTTNMIYKILVDSGQKVSMVSTINAVVGGKAYDTGFHVTSPDPFTVQKFAKTAKENEDKYLVLEVTSHALDQYRFWGIKFEVGVITNITHEHLDYHKTFENYFNTKLKLLKQVKFAVINQAIKGIQGKIITFGLDKGDFNQKEINIKLKIPGDYNIENALAALVAVNTLGIKQDMARKSIENFDNLLGRMQGIKNKKGIKIFIDFAHTPNGMEKALTTLRKQSGSGKLIAVFGSAGKRDSQKRAVMGEVAGNLADILIVTAEDPRGELERINQQIISGIKKTNRQINKDFFIIDDRMDAINFAVNNLAKKGDTVGIFGKGHETSLNLDGKKEIPWSDKEAVEKALYG